MFSSVVDIDYVIRSSSCRRSRCRKPKRLLVLRVLVD